MNKVDLGKTKINKLLLNGYLKVLSNKKQLKEVR